VRLVRMGAIIKWVKPFVNGIYWAIYQG